MKFEIKIDPEAEEFLEGVHMTYQKEIKKAIQELKVNPESGKELGDELSGFFSLRVGKYRIIYRIDDEKSIIFVIDIGHRKEVYDRVYGANES